MLKLGTPYLKKDQLIKGRAYHCDARNFSEGTWNGTNFDYMRTKFGSVFAATEKHYDDGAPHGTVKPLYEIQRIKEIPDE